MFKILESISVLANDPWCQDQLYRAYHIGNRTDIIQYIAYTISQNFDTLYAKLLVSAI